MRSTCIPKVEKVISRATYDVVWMMFGASAEVGDQHTFALASTVPYSVEVLESRC